MRYFFDHLAEISEMMKGRNLLAFFDFDLTLSPLVKDPHDALLPDTVRSALHDLSRQIPVSIISGRELSDLISRVRLPQLNYAGNHGLEWQIAGKRYAVDVEKTLLLPTAAKLEELAHRFPGAFLECKSFTSALHYRLIDPSLLSELETELAKIHPENIKIRWSKKTFDISPDISWDKGSVCLAIIQALGGPKSLPVYVGDDLTDEDAFRDLESGITIRIRKKKTSRAKYYLKNRKEILRLLCWLKQQSNGDG